MPMVNQTYASLSQLFCLQANKPENFLSDCCTAHNTLVINNPAGFY